MDNIAISLAKQYTNDSISGVDGVIAGKNCTIKSATKHDDGSITVVFAWTADDGSNKTKSITIPRGEQGPKGDKGEPGGSGGAITSDMIPDTNDKYSIGSDSKRLKAIYANEIYMSSNTLYIDGTPVFHTDNTNDIMMTADVDQSIKVKTAGVASTNVMSEKAVEVATTKETSNINITAGDYETGNASNVHVSASNNICEIAKNQITQKATTHVMEASEGVSVRGGMQIDNLTVSGNLNVQGAEVVVDAEKVEVKDNVILLNKGETGNGVTAGKAGIRIDRGELADYELIFDEVDDMFKVGKVGNDTAEMETIATQEFVNGKLEEYVKKTEGSSEIYSTNEIRIGTWIDKPLYRKVFSNLKYTSADGTSNLLVENAVADLDELIKIGAITNNSNPIPYIANGSAYTRIWLSQKKNIYGSTNIPGEVGVPIKVILEYTKVGE